MYFNLGSLCLNHKRQSRYFLRPILVGWALMPGLSLGMLPACSSAVRPHAASLPPIVAPGEPWFTPPPADAIVLFDGANLRRWQRRNGKPARWTLQDEYMEIRPWSGALWTRDAYGDLQLHLEWATPFPPRGHGQGRGNSGIKFMGLYEVQILDSYENETYPDGQAAAIYSQYPPLVNASRPPGAWQSYDILFRRPRFNADGSLAQPAIVTVLHNGVLVQDHVEVTGPTQGHDRPYEAHPDRLPLMLQNHRSRVRFRNIWIRELELPGN